MDVEAQDEDSPMDTNWLTTYAAHTGTSEELPATITTSNSHHNPSNSDVSAG